MPEYLRGRWHGAEFVTAQDQTAWLEQQRLFLRKRSRPKTKAQAKRKGRQPKAAKAVVHERLAAFNLFRGLDHAMKEGADIDLSNFTREAAGAETPLCDRPLMSLHYDECSANLAMYLYMAYALKMRVVAFRDIFHREWNDVRLALQSAGVWWAVLLSTLIFNFPHGPWEGSAWFGQLVQGITDFAKRSPAGSPLLDEFWSAICRDGGGPAWR